MSLTPSDLKTGVTSSQSFSTTSYNHIEQRSGMSEEPSQPPLAILPNKPDAVAGVRVKTYRGMLPSDFVRALEQGTQFCSPRWARGTRMGLGEDFKPTATKVFGERVYLRVQAEDLFITVIHPLVASELRNRLSSREWTIFYELRRHLRWRNSRKEDEERERLARYRSTVVLKNCLARQTPAVRPTVDVCPEDGFSDVEAEEGFWHYGDAGFLLKK